MYAAWQNLTNNSSWFETLPDIKLMYVPFKKQKFSNYQTHLWTITESSFSKLNLHTTVMVSLSLHNWKTMFASIGMRQIELVVYKSSYPTPCNITETSSEFKNSVSLKVQRNGNHTSAFRFRNLPSNANSFQTLKILSASSTCTHQLAC